MDDYRPEENLRVMKGQDVILRAVSGQTRRLDAAHTLRRSPRTLRRWRHDQYGYDELFDRRRRRPSSGRALRHTADWILRLYRDQPHTTPALLRTT